jgi:hypothetical protein
VAKVLFATIILSVKSGYVNKVGERKAQEPNIARFTVTYLSYLAGYEAKVEIASVECN